MNKGSYRKSINPPFDFLNTEVKSINPSISRRFYIT